VPHCTDAHGMLAWSSALFRAYLVQSGWFCTRRMLVMRLLGKPPCFSHHPITISVSASSSLNRTQAFQSSPFLSSHLHPYTDYHSLTPSPEGPPQSASDPGISSYLHPYIAAGSVVMHLQGGIVPDSALRRCLQLCKGASRMIYQGQMHSGEGYLGRERVSE